MRSLASRTISLNDFSLAQFLAYLRVEASEGEGAG
jgi:hypothetical protein